MHAFAGAPSGRSLPCSDHERRYDASEIEPKWQRVWEEEGLYRASDDPDDPRPPFYALDMFPYPSGDLHMGHAEAFSGGDAVARFKAMTGHNVLHPIGWDAFGLNAENAAIKRGHRIPRSGPTRTSSSRRRRSSGWGCRSTGSRVVRTCDPEYYRWTQWLFLRFFERGLAYRKNAPVNWCPNDQTVLANEQVIQGACERCGTMVERRDLTQWFFKITDYAQRLLDDMDTLVEWPERVLTMQRNWIGRSEGADVTFTIDETGDEVRGLHHPPRHAVGRLVLRVRRRAPARPEAGRAGRRTGTRCSRCRAGPQHAAELPRGGRHARRASRSACTP